MPDTAYRPLDGSSTRSCCGTLSSLEKILLLLSVALAIFVLGLTIALVNCKADQPSPNITTIAPNTTDAPTTVSPITISSTTVSPTTISSTTVSPNTTISTVTAPTTTSTTTTTVTPSTAPTTTTTPKPDNSTAVETPQE